MNKSGARILVVDNAGNGDVTRKANSFNNTNGMTWLVDAVTSYYFDEVYVAGKAHLCLHAANGSAVSFSIYYVMYTYFTIFEM